MLIPILIGIAILVAILLVVVSMQPSDFRVARSATLAAAPDAVFAQVNDLHAWEAWSPWAKLDPNAKNSFSGPPAGTGAAMAWSGNCKVGQGSMTITESRTNELVRFRLEFLKPMKATNISEFTFKPEGDQTAVTWSMTGTNSFAGKAFGLIMNCDRMIGGQFEQGFANLKSVLAAAKQ